MPNFQMRPSLLQSHDHSLVSSLLEGQLAGACPSNNAGESMVSMPGRSSAHFGDHTLPQMTKTYHFIKELRQNLPASLRVSRHATAWVADERW